ncbi:MAG: urease accessory UreF family protein [Chloroflexota bacterium]
MSQSANQTAFLSLLQLADTALPIGSLAHSFGLETLVAEGYVTVPDLADFFQAYMLEVGRVEVIYGRFAYHAASLPTEDEFGQQWCSLNQEISALKLSRESREASAVLGKRLLQLVGNLEPNNRIFQWAYASTQSMTVANHHAAVFGLIGGALQMPETTTLLAFLQQAIASQISACQRLLPLGQKQATALQWHLHPTIIEIVQQVLDNDMADLEAYSFAPLPDLASMRHPHLTTRLFIS